MPSSPGGAKENPHGRKKKPDGAGRGTYHRPSCEAAARKARRGGAGEGTEKFNKSRWDGTFTHPYPETQTPPVPTPIATSIPGNSVREFRPSTTKDRDSDPQTHPTRNRGTAPSAPGSKKSTH